MRPHNVRAAAACVAAGALIIAITLAALPGAARSETVPTTTTSTASIATPIASAASIADIVTGSRRVNVIAGRRARITGHLRPGVGGQRVLLQRLTGRGWRTVVSDVTAASGRFVLAFRARKPGSQRIRLRAGTRRERIGRLNVYRRAHASWYGPGLFGNHLSCGGRLRPGTLGVAHKTLPCGTRITLRNRGRMVRVRVIDRGPFVGGREFDLTAATKQRLRFAGVGAVLVTS